MNVLEIDLTNYRSSFGAKIPNGQYLVRVDHTETTESKAGNPMVNLWYTIIEGDQKGLEIVDRVTVSEKALFRVVGFLDALGIPTPKQRLRLDVARWVGKTLIVEVEEGEPYNGNTRMTRMEVRNYFRAPSTQAAAPADDAWAAPAEPAVAAAPAPDLTQAAPAAQAEAVPAPAPTPVPAETQHMDLDSIPEL